MKISTAIGTAVLAGGLGLAVVPTANATTAAPNGPGTATLKGASAGKSGSTTSTRGVAITKAQTRSLGGASTGSQSTVSLRSKGSCWNGRTSGRNFYETCNGSDYQVYLDCRAGANYYRYWFSTHYWGTWNFTLTCPVGMAAVWGGSN